MSLITRNAEEYRSMTAQLMSQNVPIVSSPSEIFCVLRHPNHFALPTDSSRPLFKQDRDFLYIDCMTVYFNCKYFSIGASYLSASSGFRLLGEVPAGAII